MKKIYFKDILSEEALENIAHYEYWIFDKEKEYDDSWASGCYWNAHKGDLLFSISCGKRSKKSCVVERIVSYPYYASCNGLYYIPTDSIRVLYTPAEIENIHFYTIESIDEIGECMMDEMNFKYSIEEDLFDSTKKLIWQPQNTIRVFGPSIFLGVYADETGVYIEYKYVIYQPKYSNPKRISSNAYKSIVQITMLFEDKEQLTFEIKDKPRLGYNWYSFLFQIDEKTVQRFCDINLLAIKVSYNDGNLPTVVRDDENRYADQLYLLRAWFKRTIQIYEQLGFKAEKTIIKEEKNSEENCYVYLMLDEVNGYYKIGISNSPKYRERTLQSEKPSIKLICAKEFPSRRIAEAIESALHKAYAAEHLRGEWFNLTAKDVQEITQTLA